MASVKIEGMAETKYALRRLEKRTSKRSYRRMEKAAKDIKELTSLLTPYKTGDLERSIRVKKPRVGQGFAWRRVGWDVLVDRHTFRHKHEKDYFEKMHQGPYKLGPGSRAKSAATKGRIPAGVKRGTGSSKIGKFYMRRAVEYYEKDIYEDMDGIVESEAKKF